jgi:hypothetical protein
MGRRCPTHDTCFYQAARRRMENADILVCNHAIFFSDLALRARGVGFLPPYKHVILDEAHHVEEIAAEHFGLRLGENRVRHLLRTLLDERTGRGYLAGLRWAEGTALVDHAVRMLDDVRGASAVLFDELWRWQQERGGTNGRMHASNAVEDALSSPLRELAAHLRIMRERIEDEAEKFELNAYAQRAQDLADETEALLRQAMPGCVYWVEGGKSKPRRDGRSWAGRAPMTLAAAVVEVAPTLREHLFGQEISVTMTSATLAVGKDDFQHAAARLGCEGARTLALGSVFDFPRQMRVYVDAAMPAPEDRAFPERLGDAVLRELRLARRSRAAHRPGDRATWASAAAACARHEPHRAPAAVPKQRGRGALRHLELLGRRRRARPGAAQRDHHAASLRRAGPPARRGAARADPRAGRQSLPRRSAAPRGASLQAGDRPPDPLARGSRADRGARSAHRDQALRPAVPPGDSRGRRHRRAPRRRRGGDRGARGV